MVEATVLELICEDVLEEALVELLCEAVVEDGAALLELVCVDDDEDEEDVLVVVYYCVRFAMQNSEFRRILSMRRTVVVVTGMLELEVEDALPELIDDEELEETELDDMLVDELWGGTPLPTCTATATLDTRLTAAVPDFR